MTKERYCPSMNSPELDHSDGLRGHPLLDSKKHGYVATDVDYMGMNFITCVGMFKEIKTFATGNINKKFPFAQRECYRILHNAGRRGDENYKGFYLVRFQRKFVKDSNIIRINYLLPHMDGKLIHNIEDNYRDLNENEFLYLLMNFELKPTQKEKNREITNLFL